jgi:hypothetical protein
MPDMSNTTALLLAQAVASFSRSELRWELATIAAAVAILSIALSIGLFVLKGPPKFILGFHRHHGNSFGLGTFSSAIALLGFKN